jgi:hypothetical protein
MLGGLAEDGAARELGGAPELDEGRVADGRDDVLKCMGLLQQPLL